MTPQPLVKGNHVVMTPSPATWGHIRPMVEFAIRLVLERETIFVTFIVAPIVLDRVFSDISARLNDPLQDNARRRIRIISPVAMQDIAASDSDHIGPEAIIKQVVGAYPTIYQSLLEERPIKCEGTGTVFEAVPRPSLLIIDFFGYTQTLATRAATGNTVPIFMFVASNAASMTRTVGPEEHGGFGDLAARMEAGAKETGRPAEEIGDEILNHTTGELSTLVGLPKMYDYELRPQNPSVKAIHIKNAYPTLKECDGLIITTFEKMEKGGSIQVIKSWLADWGEELYAIGPVIPQHFSANAANSRGATAVEAFLNEKLEKYGENSVILISFGTLFWPTQPEQVEELINALLDRDFPFVFCLSSPFANIPDHLVKKIEASGKGLLTKWAPQYYAVGWFLTHGGHGSIYESIASGVPLLCWPLAADQPIGSALVESLGVAIELVEVRTGPHATKPILRLGRAPKCTREALGDELRSVIDAMRGERGAAMRSVAQGLQKEFVDAWKDGGDGKKVFDAFVAKYLDN